MTEIQALFEQIGAEYDDPAMRYTAFCADQLVHALSPLQNCKVLDVATGTGMAALSVAQSMQGGRVQAIDTSAAMLEKVAEKAAHAGLDNLDLQQMDGQDLEFRSAYFDVVVCSYALPYFDDPLSALQSWRRVLKPGGKLVISTLGAKAFQPGLAQFYQDLERWGIDYEDEIHQRQLAYQNPQICIDLFRQAGFKRSRHVARQFGYHLTGNLDWWAILWQNANRRHLLTLSPEQQGEFMQQHLKALENLWTKKGFWLDVETHLMAAYVDEC